MTTSGGRSNISRAKDYWDRIRNGRPMPSRADLNPADIAPLLPYVVLIDVQRDPLDFRFRLIGTRIDELMAGRYTGLLLSDLSHMRKGNRIWADYERVVAERAPLHAGIDYVGPAQNVRRVTHALFPLSTDGTAVDMIWTVIDIEREP